MSDKPSRQTAYAEYVFSNLPKAMRVGQGMYNYGELAEMVGLKPTQHFRRRVNELVKRNIINLVPAFTPRGGIENRFTFAVTDMTGDFPF